MKEVYWVRPYLVAVLFGLALAVFIFGEGGAAERSYTGNLAGYQWDYRPLLVFAPSSDDERLRMLRELVAHEKAAMVEREMIILEVLPSAGRIDPLMHITKSKRYEVLLESEAKALREQFGVGVDEFVMVLVGKDGGEKHRYTGPDQLGRSFSDIDQMPMRRREMRSDSNEKSQ